MAPCRVPLPVFLDARVWGGAWKVTFRIYVQPQVWGTLTNPVQNGVIS